MKVIFRKNSEGFLGKVICWWTKSKYYHCELLFSDNSVFTASCKKNRTLFMPFFENPTKKDIFELNLTPEEETIVRRFCIQEEGCEYDKMGIVLSQFLPLGRHSNSRWFCSELCIAALQTIRKSFKGVKPYMCSPEDFYKLLMKSSLLASNIKYYPKKFEDKF